MTRSWRAPLGLAALGIAFIATSCSRTEIQRSDTDSYASFSRFTDPGEQSGLLDTIPDDPLAIAAVAKNLTVHHNLLAYFDVPKNRWSEIKSVWPPRVPDILAALSETGPRDLIDDRRIEQRIRGACMMESHLLAGMLRHKKIPVRLRAGYFRDVYTKEDHLVAFWEKNAREKGVAKELLQEDPEQWRQVNHDYTRQQVEVNKCVEHWVAEYWNDAQRRWQLLDANNTFLKAMSDIDVGFNLPRRHFEYAFESWKKMRNIDDFNPDQYAEWPQDGRSHIRSQLLWDFYSLLNHDIAGYDKTKWSPQDSISAEHRVYRFVKERTFEKLTAQEIDELDSLAELLSHDPTIDQLVDFYRKSTSLQIATIDTDPYSFPPKRLEGAP
ncbi:MAG: hypothetical protein OEN01_04345 [Candidatus Krumholzibacteria bacterium]|nr:hypothetical protein [Candidatus Krumholzibacteria bacterium]